MPQRRVIRAIAGLITTIPALASIPLTFSWHESPLTVETVFAQSIIDYGPIRGLVRTDWPLACLAAPFFLAIPLFAYRLRVLINPDPSGPERWLAWLGALGGIALIAPIEYLLATDDPSKLLEVVACVTPAMMLLVASVLIIPRRNHREAPFLAMAAVYSANAAIALIAFLDDRGTGWYATLVAVILHILWLAKFRWRCRAASINEA
jgi:hypothetical protein